MIDFDFAPGSPTDFPSAAPPIPPKFLADLNDRQREAVLITEGPLIVLAGAGSGKTKMLTSRISYLIEALRVPAYQILAMTFTNKAAAEMRERVEKTLARAAQSSDDPHAGARLATPEIGTFHSVCVRLLRREIGKLPFTKPFVIYDDSDQLSLIKGVLGKLGIDEKSVSPKGVQAAINRAKCDAIDPHEMEPAAHNYFERQVKRVYEQYQKDLFANNALDFGEIICMAYRLLRDHADVREKYQRRFRYIHVDEYQDTNRSQYLLLSTLASTRAGGHQNICVVGDEDQSIYKWRGADIRNILDFENDYPGAQVVKLEQNYRSTKTIINAAAHVIQNNSSRKEKTLWTDNDEGVPLVRYQVPDERAEAETVISEIKRHSEHDDRAFGDFAIFYRTNAQSRQFEDVLRREKIPYQIVGGLRFYDRKEIKDILAYFRVILNPEDSVNLKRIINVPGRGIGKTTIEKLEEIYNRGHFGSADGGEQNGELFGATKLSFWSVVERAASDPSLTSAGTARKIAGFVTIMQRFMWEQPKLLLSELYHLILDEISYVRDLRQEGTEEALARVENLEEFSSLLQEFEEDFFARVPENEREAKKPELLPLFIEQTSLASDLDQMESGSSVVKMMTLHSSKGLEFPVVFLVGMEEGLFPSVKPWEETLDEDIEEERRLCYVGITRARENLYMLNALVRRQWGDINYQEPSRFFEEIPENLIHFRDYTQGSGRPFGLAGRKDFSQSRGSAFQSDDVPQISISNVTALPSRFAQSDEMVGRRLEHPEYGDGTVLAVEGSGEDRKLTVEFRGRERRKFLFRYVASYLK